jgi:hypothetical protein
LTQWVSFWPFTIVRILIPIVIIVSPSSSDPWL